MMLKSRLASLKGSRLGPFSLGVTLFACQESPGAGQQHLLRVRAWGINGRLDLVERNSVRTLGKTACPPRWLKIKKKKKKKEQPGSVKVNPELTEYVNSPNRAHSRFSAGVIFVVSPPPTAPREIGQWAMTRDIVGCHNWEVGATGV